MKIIHRTINLLYNNPIQITIVLILILSLLLPMSYAFCHEIWVDPSVILKEMECIADGYIPYQTMHLNYPPLYFYFLVLLKNIFHVPYACYEFYLCVNFLLLLFSGWCIYAVSLHICQNRRVSWLSAWLYVGTMLSVGATSVLFEVPSILLGLLSIICIIQYEKRANKWNLLFSGILASCSFLVKQFGFGFILLNAFYIITQKRSLKSTLLFIVGSSIPFITALAVFGIPLIESTIFNGYGTEINQMAGEDISMKSKISHIYSCCMVFVKETSPIVFTFFACIPFFKKQWKWIVFCLLGLSGFAMQYYFCSSDYHYQQYMIPFAVLLLPIAVSNNLSGLSKIFVGLLFIFNSCQVFYKIDYVFCWEQYSEDGYVIRNHLSEQRQTAQKINDIINDGETLWTPHHTLLCYLYLYRATTPNMKEVAYSSGPWELTKEKAAMQVRDADYILSLKQSAPNYGWFEWFAWYFDKNMRDFVFKKKHIEIDNNTVIYKMKQ